MLEKFGLSGMANKNLVNKKVGKEEKKKAISLGSEPTKGLILLFAARRPVTRQGKNSGRGGGSTS